jgi:hypothetical protein
MKTLPALSRRTRWAVPAGAVTAVAAVAAVSAITVAQAAPRLPARTPAQLLAAVASQHSPPPALTGTVVETASLGIPQLPGGAGLPDSITSLLAGSHTIRVWYGGPGQVRLAVPVTMGETDFIRNGDTAWLWQSSQDSATRFIIPFRRGPARGGTDGGPAVTPQQAARQVLAAVGPTTRVTTESNVTVAGQPAYQLVLAPRDSRSLVGKVTIAVDGQHLGVPLRVQVFARGAAAPAFQVGYTSISFVRPAAANFRFTPPAGAKVHTAFAPGGGWVGATPGTGWSGIPPRAALPGRMFRRLPRHMRLIPIPVVPNTRRGAGSAAPPRGPAGFAQAVPEHMPVPGHMPMPGQPPRVVGKGWLSVAVLPAGAFPLLAGHGNAAAAAGQAARSVTGGAAVSNPAIMGVLLRSATPVHGSWGSGRLLRTSLFSVLLTSNGHMLIGAVEPAVLYAAAQQVK